jgi:mRNA-degrading endonuclease RelE of RelBE toxin-antitoxin system
MTIKPLRKDLISYLSSHGLSKRWSKMKELFEKDIRHPSLHVELLEPHWRGIYSFKLGHTYRVLYFIDGDKAEVFQITKHYKKS